MKRLTVIAILLNLALLCRGEIVITEANCNKPIDLTENIFYYEDPTGEMTFKTAASETFFRNYNQLPGNIITVGGNNCDIWVLISMKNNTRRRQDFFLSLKNPTIDELVFHSTKDSTFFNTGLRYPFTQRPSDSKFYNFNISINPLSSTTYCIKFSSQRHLVHVPIVIQPDKYFFDEGSFDQTMNCLVYALALLTILAMTLLYISERDKVYIICILLMVGILILLFHYDLTLFKFVFPNSPSTNALVGKLMKPLILTAFIYYLKYTMPPRPFKKVKSNPSNIMITLGFLTVLISFLSFEFVFRALFLYLFITMCFVYFFYCAIY